MGDTAHAIGLPPFDDGNFPHPGVFAHDDWGLGDQADDDGQEDQADDGQEGQPDDQKRKLSEEGLLRKKINVNMKAVRKGLFDLEANKELSTPDQTKITKISRNILLNYSKLPQLYNEYNELLQQPGFFLQQEEQQISQKRLLEILTQFINMYNPIVNALKEAKTGAFGSGGAKRLTKRIHLKKRKRLTKRIHLKKRKRLTKRRHLTKRKRLTKRRHLIKRKK